MTDTPEDSQTEQTPGAESLADPVDTPPAPPPATSTGRDHQPPPSGNLLTRILVPAYLVVLILVFTDVLLITWPITHADESVVCPKPMLAMAMQSELDGDGDSKATADSGFDPFGAVDQIVHDLIQYCPDAGEASARGATALNKQDQSRDSGVGEARTDGQNDVQNDVQNDDQNENQDGIENNEPNKQEGQARSKYSVPRQGNALFLAVLSAGMIGGAVYSLRAHTVHIAIGKYQASWWQWNVTRPFLSGALAILFFFLVRAGFVEGGQAGSLRPEGFIAIGGLVGLFTDQAWAKIRQVANAMFAEADHGAETGHTPPVTTPPQTEAGTPSVAGAGGGAAPVPPGN